MWRVQGGKLAVDSETVAGVYEQSIRVLSPVIHLGNTRKTHIRHEMPNHSKNGGCVLLQAPTWLL